MKQLLVRNVPAGIARKLRARAAQSGVSVEEAHRRLLTEALNATAATENAAFVAWLLTPEGRTDDLPVRPRRTSAGRRVKF